MAIDELVGQVREHLQRGEIFVLDEEPMEHGVRLHCHNDSLVLVYKTGKVVVQGKNHHPTKQALATFIPASKAIERSELVAVKRADVTNAWKYCTECTALMPRLWRFCVACGAESFSESDTGVCECSAVIDRAWKCCPECGRGL